MAERLTRLTCVECGREQTDDERGWWSRIFGAKGPVTRHLNWPRSGARF
jgi:hypothetical protein